MMMTRTQWFWAAGVSLLILAVGGGVWADEPAAPGKSTTTPPQGMKRWVYNKDEGKWVIETIPGEDGKLIAQPQTVLGFVQNAKGKEGEIEAKASHVAARGRWRVYDGPLPTLKQLDSYYQDPVSIYGIYLWPEQYLQYREDIKKVGFSNIRVGGLQRQLEKCGDEAVGAMIEDKQNFVLVLDAKKRDEFETDEAYIDNALKTFKKIIGRYGPGGTFFKKNPKLASRPAMYYQILNEPNFQYMYKGDGTNKMIPIRIKLYAKLLPAAYKMIKEIDPKIQVVGWTCGGAAAQDLNFVKQGIAANPEMAKCFDVFSTHPYTQPAPADSYAIQSWGEYSVPGMLMKIRAAFAKAGRPASKLPVWYTEGGWRLSRAAGGMSSSGVLDKDMHAACYLRYYLMGLRLGVNRITPMYIVDADGFNGGVFNRTVKWKRDDKNPWRPVAFAIQNMIKLMPNPKLRAIIADGNKDDEFILLFANDKLAKDSGETIAAWKAAPKAKTVTVTLPKSISKPVVVDMYGHFKPLEAKDGKVQIDIGPYPVFVTQGK